MLCVCVLVCVVCVALSCFWFVLCCVVLFVVFVVLCCVVVLLCFCVAFGVVCVDGAVVVLWVGLFLADCRVLFCSVRFCAGLVCVV